MKRALYGAGVLAVGLSLVVPAIGHNKSFRSKVTISHDKSGATWSGTVESSKKACVRNRLVKLFFDTEKDILLSEDRTDAQGRWEISLAPGDTYYATVKRARKGQGSHKHICKPDKSPTIP